MTIYISNFRQDARHHEEAKIYGNDIDELHQLAKSLGVPNMCFDHADGSYTITDNKIDDALHAGAIVKEFDL